MTSATSHNRLKLLYRLECIGVRRNELLQDLVDVARIELLEFDLHEDAATLIAHALADRIADYWGGQSISFPRDRQWHLGIKELELYDLWSSGVTLPELTRRSGMTSRGLRKALARIQRKLRKQSQKHQSDLFRDE